MQQHMTVGCAVERGWQENVATEGERRQVRRLVNHHVFVGSYECAAVLGPQEPQELHEHVEQDKDDTDTMQ
jgi:hypothetical protein